MKKLKEIYLTKNRYDKQTSKRKPKKYWKADYATGIYFIRDFSKAKINLTSFLAA